MPTHCSRELFGYEVVEGRQVVAAFDLLRADSGFARDELMAWCEANGVEYVFGLARNERLVGAIANELAAAEADSLVQGGPTRRFADLAWRTLDSWSRERRVVAKAEHLPRVRTRASS